MKDDLETLGEVNPLLRPLAEVEYALLETIWRPACSEIGWPTWDYVSRSMCQREPAVIDAGRLLGALPSIDREFQMGLYGLVWSTDSYALNPGSYIGLTIAGLFRLGESVAPANDWANDLAQLVRYLADAERAVVPDPAGVVDPKMSINAILSRMASQAASRLSPLRPGVVRMLLQKEYPLLSFDSSEADNFVVRLSPLLRHFLDIESASDYVDVIGRSARVPMPLPVSDPRELPRILDHLSYVLRSHAGWTCDPLVRSPDIESPATLSMPVMNAVDFRDRMSALARVIENLNVPEVSPASLGRYEGRQPGSINRLDEWLRTALQDEAAVARAADAVKTLRAAIRLRVEGQHVNNNAQKQARQARGLLGLPDPIREYGAAWDMIRGRVSDALEIIRQEVQYAIASE